MNKVLIFALVFVVSVLAEAIAIALSYNILAIIFLISLCISEYFMIHSH